MATPGEHALRWKPRSVADTVDGDNSSPGAMTALTDLIPDPSTPNCFVCRPANTVEINFTTWSGAVPNGTAGPIVVAFEVGNIIYGLVGITTGTFAGLDYPFAYNKATGAFLTVSGVTAAKCPTSQATSGDWVPPQMTLTGIKLVVIHTGYDGASHFFGSFDLTTPTSPAYTAGNTATNGLPSVPQAGQSFNNRTYFFCGNVAYYTDTLALTMTNANQSFTIDDYTSITCAAPLPVGTTSQGIVQGILAFKLNKVFLITGDVVTSNLSTNLLSPSVGTAAPRSVVSTPEGVKFMSNDGIRLINFYGFVSEPDPDLAVPFINALYPSRVCAAFNADTYRICVQNAIVAGTPYQDYWYNIKNKCWTGPHSFRYDTIVPYSNDFVLASNSITGKLWNSFSVQSHGGVGNTFTENGVAMNWTYTTAPMTDLENLYANAVIRTTLEMALPASGQAYNFTAQNESGTSLSTAVVTTPSSQSIWGSFNWGASLWGAAQTGLVPVTLPWISTVVFNKLSIMANGPSALGVKIGSLHNGYKRLQYLLN